MSIRDLVRSVNSGSSLQAEIDVHLLKLERLPSNRDIGWHPSDFCDMCARARIISLMTGITLSGDEISPRLRRIFDVGTALHAWYQEQYFGRMGILWGKWRCSRCHNIRWGVMPTEKCSCSSSQKAGQCIRLCGDSDQSREKRGGCIHCGIWGRWEYRELNFKYQPQGFSKPIVGHVDGVIRINGVWHIIEIKTINSFGFSGLSEEVAKHRRQAQVYFELYRLKAFRYLPDGVNPPEAEKIIHWYIGKNTSEEKEFIIDPSSGEAAEIMSGPKEYEDGLREKRVPARHPDCPSRASKRAKKCPVGSVCFPDITWQELLRYGVKG